MLKRVIYLGYYIKELDQNKFSKFSDYVVKNYSTSKGKLWLDVIISCLKYNISILDYFYFRFYELNREERREYAGTGYMYEYQLKMNPKNERDILENKLNFLGKYSKFISHNYASKKDFITNGLIAKKLMTNPSKRLILKSSDGQCGEGIQVVKLDELGQKELLEKVKDSNNDLIEEFIIQHNDLMRLSPSGLNTIRIFTQLHKGKVEVLGARLRITINSYVDNLAAGNIAAPIDETSGIVNGSGVYSDITKKDEHKHPITGIEIVGFQIPFWKESMIMVKEAALLYKENRSIGWDVAITNNGPELLEGNHNWCKLLWQLPVKKGLKYSLDKYL